MGIFIFQFFRTTHLSSCPTGPLADWVKVLGRWRRHFFLECYVWASRTKSATFNLYSGIVLSFALCRSTVDMYSDFSRFVIKARPFIVHGRPCKSQVAFVFFHAAQPQLLFRNAMAISSRRWTGPVCFSQALESLPAWLESP